MAKGTNMKKAAGILLLSGLLAVLVLAGCSRQITRKELDKQHDGEVKITFNVGEGGMITGTDKITELFYYYPQNSYAVEVGTGALSSAYVSKANHFLEGWYRDAAYTEKWNFSTDRLRENTTLYAKWLPNFRYDFYAYEQDENDRYNEVLVGFQDVAEGGVLPSTADPKREGYTLLGFYKDQACTQAWDYAHTHAGAVVNGESVGTAEKVYTKWLQGEYTLVRTPADLLGIATGNFYLMNNIDFADQDDAGAVSWIGHQIKFGGTLEGNGYAIKNIAVSYPATFEIPPYTTECGIFAAVTEDAKIRNVTFENAVLTVSDTRTIRRTVGLFAGTIENGATIENVTVSGKIVLQQLAHPENYTLGKLAGKAPTSYGTIAWTGIAIESAVDGLTVEDDPADPTGNRQKLTRE